MLAQLLPSPPFHARETEVHGQIRLLILKFRDGQSANIVFAFDLRDEIGIADEGMSAARSSPFVLPRVMYYQNKAAKLPRNLGTIREEGTHLRSLIFIRSEHH
jgi:hypothetical protein